MRKRVISVLLSGTAGLVATLGVLAVVAAAFALSFDAIRSVAIAAHITPGLAWLYPVAVDGAMATATVCAVVMRARGRSAVYPWAVVLFGALVSVVANALHAWVAGGALALPASWAVLLSAVPPVLLALSVHLLIVLALAIHPDSASNRPAAAVEVVDETPAPVPAAAAAVSTPVSRPQPATGEAAPAGREPRPRDEGGGVPDLFTGSGLVMPLTAPVSRVNGKAVR